MGLYNSNLIIIDMKWITLKLKNLPIISLEIDRALEVFETMISKYDTFRKRDDFQEILELRAQFKSRVTELDTFYKEYHLDDNIAIFHMLKIKLERALFKVNRFNNQKSFNQLSFKDDSLNLFQDNQIKLLDQPLFTYYESSIKKNNKEDYLEFAKDAPKEEISSFGGQKNEKKVTLARDVRTEKAPQQLKNQFSFTSNQLPKSKLEKEPISKPTNQTKKQPILNKNYPSKRDIKKPEKKVNVSYKTASFTTNHMQKIQQQKAKEKKSNSPENPTAIQGNFLQCLNNQNQLKFTIKMTRDEYKSLLQMKKKLGPQRNL